MNIEQLARDLIRAERLRHATLGYDAEHDAGHAEELRRAAGSYRMSAHASTRPTQERLGITPRVPKMWPWDEPYWKPKTAKLDLIRAGALYLACADAETYPAGRSNAQRDYEWIVKDLVAVLVTEPLELLIQQARAMGATIPEPQTNGKGCSAYAVEGDPTSGPCLHPAGYQDSASNSWCACHYGGPYDPKECEVVA